MRTEFGGVLDHRCPACGHPALDHDDVDVSLTTCRHLGCRCRTDRYHLVSGEPIVYPLYVGTGQRAGDRIAQVAPPGVVLGGYRSCACHRHLTTHLGEGVSHAG